MRFFLSALLALSFTSLAALSESDLREYRALCAQSARDETAYKQLRRHPLHSRIIEPFSKGDGYCLQIERETPRIEALYTELSLLEQKLKGPLTSPAQGFALSPLILRHAQIAIELEREFGQLKDLRILQIGAGFGQLAAVLAKTQKVSSYTLVDLPECLALQRKFLNSCGVSNVTYLEPRELDTNTSYDLVICTFPFTQWADAAQRDRLFELLAHIPKGYITCHEPWNYLRPDQALEDALLLKLARAGHRVHCGPERGDPAPLHSVIRWGEQTTTISHAPPPKPSKAKQTQSAVLMSHEGGRLGDKLLCYAHAKWVAHRYHLPLIIRSFPYVENFGLSRLWPMTSPQFSYQREIHPKSHREILQNLSKPSTLFVIDYFAETDFEARMAPNTGAYFYTGWRDRGFLKSLREDLTPLVPLEAPLLDSSDVHVAVHLRLGGSFDDPKFLQTKRELALKSPRHQFYVQQIKRVAAMFEGKSIQVHLFTDDEHPERLAELYTKMLNNSALHFTYRNTKNAHNLHVLDDFFAMSAFDCLIHPQSYFSILAAQLGDFAVRLTPVHATWKGTYWDMDQFECCLDGNHALFKNP